MEDALVKEEPEMKEEAGGGEQDDLAELEAFDVPEEKLAEPDDVVKMEDEEGIGGESQLLEVDETDSVKREAVSIPENRFYRPPRPEIQAEPASEELQPAAVAAPEIKRKPEPEFTVGFDFYSEEEKEKRARRAEKFGMKTFDPVSVVEGFSREERDRRRKRMNRFGINFDTKDKIMETVRKYELPSEPQLGVQSDYRYNAVNLYGITTDMTTKCIYQYFGDYGPRKVEWLNDSSCNVVFPDKFTCKRAIMCVSLPISGELERVRSTAKEDEIKDIKADLEFILWRKAKPLRGNRLLLRLCHKSDVKKPVNERKPSLWFKKHIKKRRGRSRVPKQINISAPSSRKAIRINPRSIHIRKKDRELKKTVETLHQLKLKEADTLKKMEADNLKIEIENEDVIPAKDDVKN